MTIQADQDFAASMLVGFNQTSAILSGPASNWRPSNEYQAAAADMLHRAMGHRDDQPEF